MPDRGSCSKFALLFAAAAIAVAGCEEEPAARVAPHGQNPIVTPPPRSARPQPKPVDQIEFAPPGESRPATFTKLYARLSELSDDRPAVLQLSNNEDSRRERVPSIHFQVRVDKGPAERLVQQTLRAKVHLLTDKGESGLWTSPDDQPVELTISQCDAAGIRGEITRGVLVNVTTGATTPLAGQFRAEFAAAEGK